MDWFLCDNGLRHERVKEFHLLIVSVSVIIIIIIIIITYILLSKMFRSLN